MKWRYVIVGVFLLFCICVLPASAADDFGVGKIDSEYLIRPLSVGDMNEPRSSISSSVTQGQVRYFNHYVTPGSTEIDIHLSWTLIPNYNSLSLRITTPDGLVFTDYSDTYEHPIENGLIPLKLINNAGLPFGTWRITVIGTEVEGVQLFNLGINSY